MTHHINETQTSYDRVAKEYTERIADELAHKPLDRQLLDRLAKRVQGLGPVEPQSHRAYIFARRPSHVTIN